MRNAIRACVLIAGYYSLNQPMQSPEERSDAVFQSLSMRSLNGFWVMSLDMQYGAAEKVIC